MSSSQVHATLVSLSASPKQPAQNRGDHSIQLTVPPQLHDLIQAPQAPSPVDFSARAQWLRAAVLGANDGLVSVASLMIGVGAVNQTSKAMLVSGLAGLVAGACSMAIGELVSVYAQYDIEVAQMEREKAVDVGETTDVSEEEKKGSLPSPWRAAGASALAFAIGALLPLLVGGFIRPWPVRIGAVCAATSVGLAGFGAAGAALGGVKVFKPAVRVLSGGWLAMGLSYGVLRLFGLAFGTQVSSS